jgi:hypothetical protein
MGIMDLGRKGYLKESWKKLNHIFPMLFCRYKKCHACQVVLIFKNSLTIKVF